MQIILHGKKYDTEESKLVFDTDLQHVCRDGYWCHERNYFFMAQDGKFFRVREQYIRTGIPMFRGLTLQFRDAFLFQDKRHFASLLEKYDCPKEKLTV
jgi:hypothetical protein